jgi:hypothetical protein
MKRSSIFVALFTLLVCFGAVQALEANPQLEVLDGISFDFGDVQPNQTLTHNFIFKNHGDSTLNILKAKGG